MAYADGNIIIGTSVDVGGINTGLYKIEKSFKRLGKMAALGIGIKAFTGLGKAALEAASNLQEVQNVVDVSFTKLDEAGNVISDMTYKIEGFAQTCIEKFGMSEYSAKQTAGSFMAMGKAMGLSMEEASDMAVKLTALSGDFASFHNISQEYARTALAAVYSGETETLRRYGVLITETNLQQYAMNKGIEVSVKKMNARDKALLRYMYILEATKDVEGDFVRTQDSWANSTRVLQQLWNQFLIVLGSGLISVLTPMVQVLGQIVQRLMQFTQTLWVALSNIFGFELQDITQQAKGAGEAIGDMAGAVEDLGDEIDKAGKKAKKQLGTFDELNNLMTTDSSSSGKADAGLNIGDISGDISGLWDYKEKDSPWSDIDNLYDLGKWIGQKLCDMMESIDWDSVYEKARNFGKGLADFLNGLISTDLFKDLGHTIAAALNTAIYAALEFARTFDWSQFGQKLAAGINEFFRTFDFAAFAQAINAWVLGLKTFIKELITNINWFGEDGVFAGLKEFIQNLDPEAVLTITGFIFFRTLLPKALKLLFKSLGSMLGTTFSWLLSGTSPGILASNIASFISAAFQAAFYIVQGFVTQTIPNFFSPIITAIGNFFNLKIPSMASSLSGGFETLFHNLALGDSLNASLTYAFGPVATTILGIVTTVAGAALAIKEFFDMWVEGWSLLKTILEAIGIAIAAVGAVILGAEVAAAAIVAGLVFAISQIAIYIHDHWEEIKELWGQIGPWFDENVIQPVVEFVSGLWEDIKGIAKGAWEAIKEFFAPIISFFEGLFKRIGQFAEGCWILIKAIWILVSAWFKENVIDPVVGFFVRLWEDVKLGFETLWGNVKAVWEAVSTWFNEHVIQPVVEWFQDLWEDVKEGFQIMWDNVKEIWEVVSGWFDENVIQPLIDFFAPIVETISGFFSSAWDKIKSTWNSVVTWFETTIIEPFKEAWDDAVEAIKGFFDGLWDSITGGIKGALNSMIGSLEKGINWIIDQINKLLGGFNKVVSWAAKIAETDWGGVDLVPNIKIPRLATGTVVPPNNPFMAMLGDNKREPEVVSPLSTMKQAMLEALREAGVSGGGGNGDIVVQIDGKEIFRAVRNENNMFKKSNGVSAF